MLVRLLLCWGMLLPIQFLIRFRFRQKKLKSIKMQAQWILKLSLLTTFIILASGIMRLVKQILVSGTMFTLSPLNKLNNSITSTMLVAILLSLRPEKSTQTNLESVLISILVNLDRMLRVMSIMLNSHYLLHL